MSSFHNVTFAGNVADANGGAIIMTVRSNAFFDQCFFFYNEAQSKGGAIGMTNMARATVQDSYFTESQGNAGGGVYTDDNAWFLMYRTVMENQLASSRGGSFYCAGKSEVNIYNSTIQGNRVYDGVGGGFAVQDFSNVTLFQTIIQVQTTLSLISTSSSFLTS